MAGTTSHKKWPGLAQHEVLRLHTARPRLNRELGCLDMSGGGRQRSRGAGTIHTRLLLARRAAAPRVRRLRTRQELLIQ